MDLFRLVPSLLGTAWVRHIAMGTGSEVSFLLSSTWISLSALMIAAIRSLWDVVALELRVLLGLVTCLGEGGAVAYVRDVVSILSPEVVELMLECRGNSFTSGLGICLGDRSAVATVGIAIRLLSPGDTWVGPLGGDAYGLPLYVADMAWINVKEKCWSLFFASSLKACSSSSFLCL